MSYQASEWAARVAGCPRSAKAILMVIAEAADPEGYTFIGYDEIARRASTHRRTVIRQMKWLQDNALVKVSRRWDAAGHRTSNGLLLAMGAAGNPATEQTANQGDNVSLRDRPKVTECHLGEEPKVTTRTGLGDNAYPPKCQPVTLTSLEPVTNRESARPRGPMPIPAGYPDAEAIAEARELAQSDGRALDIEKIARKFRLHHQSKDTRVSDWRAKWLLWVAKDLETAPPLQTRPALVVENSEDDVWRSRMKGLAVNDYWTTTEWGPRPGKKDCRVPEKILAEFKTGAAA